MFDERKSIRWVIYEIFELCNGNKDRIEVDWFSIKAPAIEKFNLLSSDRSKRLILVVESEVIIRDSLLIIDK